MKTYWGGGTAPRILNLGSRKRSVDSFTSRPLYPQRKKPWYPLYRRLGGPQSLSGHGDEGKNSQPLSAVEPPSPEFRQNENIPKKTIRISGNPGRIRRRKRWSVSVKRY